MYVFNIDYVHYIILILFQSEFTGGSKPFLKSYSPLSLSKFSHIFQDKTSEMPKLRKNQISSSSESESDNDIESDEEKSEHIEVTNDRNNVSKMGKQFYGNKLEWKGNDNSHIYEEIINKQVNPWIKFLKECSIIL